MKSKFIEVYRHAIIYGLGSVSQQLIGFLLLPLYTSYLAPEDYGRLALINAMSSILSLLLGMGLTSAFIRFFVKAENDDQRQEITSTALVWLLGVGVVWVAILWPNAGLLAKWLLDSGDYSLYLQIMGVNLVFNLLQAVPAGIFRSEKRSGQYVLFALSDFILGIGLNIYFVVVLRIGVLGILLTDLIATALIVSVELYVCRHLIRLAFSRSTMGSMLRYGLPLVLSGINVYVLNQADRWFLRYYSTMDAVGVYALAYKLGMSINVLLNQPIQLVWFPTALEMEKNPGAERFYGKILTYVALINLWAALGLSIFAKEILILMTTPRYYAAHGIIPWVAFSYVLLGCFSIVNIGTLLTGKTQKTIPIFAAAGISNLLFDFLLIPRFGAFGAALATLLSQVVLFAVGFVVNRRIYPIQYQWGRISKIIAACGGLFLIGQLSFANLYLTIVFKATLMLSYFGILWMLGFYEPGEIDWARSLVRKYLKPAAANS